jgi:hypothetical protein
MNRQGRSRLGPTDRDWPGKAMTATVGEHLRRFWSWSLRPLEIAPGVERPHGQSVSRIHCQNRWSISRKELGYRLWCGFKAMHSHKILFLLLTRPGSETA